MQLPKYKAWVKSQQEMVDVTRLTLAPAEEAGIEYMQNGQSTFVPIRECEIRQSVNILDHSGNEYYLYDVILTKTGIGVLVFCDGNLGLASWVNGAYHCFCSIGKSELECSEIIGNIYEESFLLVDETA